MKEKMSQEILKERMAGRNEEKQGKKIRNEREKIIRNSKGKNGRKE